jgi:MFS family permease
MDRFDPKIFATLLFSIFATVTGVGIVVPLLPLYARDLGASGLFIGLIFGAFSLSRTLFLPYFGRLSDRKGRKTLIVTGLFAYAVISTTFIFSKSVTSLIVIRLIHGVASAMLMPVIQAYIGDIAPPGREGRLMGFHSASVLFGLGFGPLIGGFVMDAYGITAAFASMGALALIGFTASLMFLPPVASEHALRNRKNLVPWRTLLSDRKLAGLFFFRLAYVLCIGIIWGFVPLYADQTLSLSGTSIGALITLGIVVSGILNVPMGFIADRMNRPVMVAVGGLIAAYAILRYKDANSYHDMAFASVLFGVGGGTCMPALMAMAALKGIQREALGSVMALMTVAHSLGMLTGALLAGLLMDAFQLRLVFPVGGAVMVAGTGLFLLSIIPGRRLAELPARAVPEETRATVDSLPPA